MSNDKLSTLQEQLTDYIEENFSIRINSDQQFDELGLFNSIDMILFIKKIESLTDFEIPQQDLLPENFSSIDACLHYMDKTFGMAK